MTTTSPSDNLGLLFIQTSNLSSAPLRSTGLSYNSLSSDGAEPSSTLFAGFMLGQILADRNSLAPSYTPTIAKESSQGSGAGCSGQGGLKGSPHRAIKSPPGSVTPAPLQLSQDARSRPKANPENSRDDLVGSTAPTKSDGVARTNKRPRTSPNLLSAQTPTSSQPSLLRAKSDSDRSPSVPGGGESSSSPSAVLRGGDAPSSPTLSSEEQVKRQTEVLHRHRAQEDQLDTSMTMEKVEQRFRYRPAPPWEEEDYWGTRLPLWRWSACPKDFHIMTEEEMQVDAQ